MERPGHGWSVLADGASMLPVTSEVIEALLPWKHRLLGKIAVDDTLDPAVTSLINTQKPNGTWGNNLLDTVLAHHAIKAATANPIYPAETITYFEDKQKKNGSFDDNVYLTAKVVTALSVGLGANELLITDITPTSSLQTGAVSTFNVRLVNPGTVAIDRGALHLIIDDYHLASFDFEQNQIVVNAGSTVDLALGISNTRNFQGDVALKVFIEGENGVIYANSNYEEAFIYLADPSHHPGLPLYYVGYKNVSSAGAPAITWRWPIKFDPNLNKIVLMWRLEGSSSWSGANVSATTTTSSATVGGLVNNVVYEATLGTSDQSGNTYFFSGGGISRVKVSDVASVYTNGSVAGKVKSVDGSILADVTVVGVNPATASQTNENGDFLQNQVPWGTGYARLADPRYESYLTKYTTADTNLTNVNVYTKLR